eukprot:1678611-Ditylum_brightwellii.AAC.1
MVRQNPQAVHTGFCCSLQHKWSYLQRVTNIDPANYMVLDNVICKELLPALLDADSINDSFVPLFSLPVKSAGIGALSPVQEQPLCCETSVQSTMHLKEVILQVHPLNLQDHSKCMEAGKAEGQKNKSLQYEAVLEQVTSGLSPDVAHAI